MQGDILIFSDTDKEEDYFPVFYEELDFLGFKDFWKYPECKEPLLWGKDAGAYIEYWYKGKLVAKVRKGALFKKHSIQYVEKGLQLEPMDLEKLKSLYESHIRDLTNEALDYINMEVEKFKEFGHGLVVSYSGGKDSQVVIDLVLQVVPYKDLYVVFTDTKMELDDTYKTVELTEEYYRKFFPDFKIHVVSSPFETAELWELFGPPSRLKRWCCSVYKIAPQVKFLDRLGNAGSNSVLVFEGTRASESKTRANSCRTSPREKTFREINIRPVFHWRDFDVYMYILLKELPLNPLYRKGFRRVGCSVCPFASNWSEYLIENLYPHRAERFIRVLENYAYNMGVEKQEELIEYISSGAWKMRAGGVGLKSEQSVEFLREENSLKAVLKGRRENFFEWVKTVGTLHLLEEKDGYKKGELRVGDAVIKFAYKEKGDITRIEFHDLEPHPVLYSKLEKVLYKTTYCLHCTGCEVECPHSAVITYPKVVVNSSKCTHCGNCLDFLPTGCYVAESVKISIAGGMKKERNMKVNRYLTFGLRGRWLHEFMEIGSKWLIDNTLGVEQKKAMNNYLFDIGLIDKNKQITEFFHTLQKVFIKDTEAFWQIVWVELCINSDLFRFYVEEVPWGKVWTKEELVKKLVEEKGVAERTARNGINSLTNTLEESPLGQWFGRKEGKGQYFKVGTDKVSSLVVGYALYRLKDIKGWRGTTIRELARIKEGPIAWLGIPKEILRYKILSLKNIKLVDADLVADLDNIFFYDFDSKGFLKEVVRKWTDISP